MSWEVFIIDDDRTICLIHKYLLKLVHQKEPAIYTNALKALELIANKNEEDKFLIYLDINMPEIDGWDFIKRLENFSNPTRFLVVIVTSSVDELDKKKAKKYELVKGYVEKPLTKSKLKYLSPFIKKIS